MNDTSPTISCAVVYNHHFQPIMAVVYKQSNCKHGGGLVNSLINNLPFELHYPGGYKYLGPGTKLEKRLKRGDKPKNKLDEAALKHDIAYKENKDLDSRHRADQQLENEAWSRVTSSDAKTGERIAAYLTTNLMKVKRKLGMGMKKKKKSARNCRRRRCHPKKRILPVPKTIGGGGKTGGILPLLPIMGALGTIGTIASNADSVVKLARNLIGAKKDLRGSGMFLAPYRSRGSGLVLSSSNQQNPTSPTKSRKRKTKKNKRGRQKPPLSTKSRKRQTKKKRKQSKKAK
jgi:hypothetical protein